MPKHRVVKGIRSLAELQGIVKALRMPDGCPWDRAQTHSSLRSNLLQECHEALEALDNGDSAAVKEELGDVLVQVLFHCQIAGEAGEYTLQDLIEEAGEKLVRRHPHVFGGVTVNSIREVEENWESQKLAESNRTSALDGVPTSTPALTYAQTISHRAARSGFEWPDFASVMAKLEEELVELAQASTAGHREEELGDVIFSLVNVARWLGIDSESALRRASAKFRMRFRFMEQFCKDEKRFLSDLSSAQKEDLWQKAKEVDISK